MNKKSRILAYAVPLLVVLAGLIAYEYGYQSVRREMASIKEIQFAKTRTLEKHLAVISEKPILEKKLATLTEKRKADDSKMVRTDTLSLAAATLQDTIKAIITGRGGTISSERVEKPEDVGKFKAVNVSMDIILPDARALGDVLYGIETRTPYIIIKEIDVRIREFRQPRELVVKLRIATLSGGK